MIKISTRGRYGLRIMLELARNYDLASVQADAIAKNQEISANYIHLLVKELQQAGLIKAVRGPNGGYALARHPSAINAYEIIAALEGKTGIVECTGSADVCSRSASCVARQVWKKVDEAIKDVLIGINLEEMAGKPGLHMYLGNDHLDFQI